MPGKHCTVLSLNPGFSNRGSKNVVRDFGLFSPAALGRNVLFGAVEEEDGRSCIGLPGVERPKSGGLGVRGPGLFGRLSARSRRSCRVRRNGPCSGASRAVFRASRAARGSRSLSGDDKVYAARKGFFFLVSCAACLHLLRA